MAFKDFLCNIIFLILVINQIRAEEGYNFNDKWSIYEVEFDNLNADVSFWKIDFADSLNGMIGAGYPNFGVPSFIRTTNGGMTWEMMFEMYADSVVSVTNYNGGPCNREYHVQKIRDLAYPDTSVCLAITHDNFYPEYDDYILRSEDKGKTWSLIMLPEGNAYIKLKMRNKDTGAVAGKNLCFTYDGGKTWQEYKLPDSLQKYFIKDFDWPENDVIILHTIDTSYPEYLIHILSTDDFGLTWNDYHFDIEGTQKSWSFSFPDSKNGWCGFFHEVEDDQYKNLIYYSNDGGKSWIKQFDTISHQTSEYSNMDIEFYDENYGISVGYTSEIYLTTDGGKNWYEQSPWYEGKTKFITANSACFIKPNLIFVCGAFSSIIRYEGDPVGVKEEKNLYISDLGIYPNPAKTGTPINIKYKIERPGRLEFQIYDCLGNEMDAPYSIYSAAGAFTVTYTPDRDFPPGVYFMRIVTGDVVVNKSFLVE